MCTLCVTVSQYRIYDIQNYLTYTCIYTYTHVRVCTIDFIYGEQYYPSLLGRRGNSKADRETGSQKEGSLSVLRPAPPPSPKTNNEVDRQHGRFIPGQLRSCRVSSHHCWLGVWQPLVPRAPCFHSSGRGVSCCRFLFCMAANVFGLHWPFFCFFWLDLFPTTSRCDLVAKTLR